MVTLIVRSLYYGGACEVSFGCICGPNVQGFMQDQIIASHTCFGGHVDVNC